MSYLLILEALCPLYIRAEKRFVEVMLLETGQKWLEGCNSVASKAGSCLSQITAPVPHRYTRAVICDRQLQIAHCVSHLANFSITRPLLASFSNIGASHATYATCPLWIA